MKQKKIFGIGLSRTGTTSCYYVMKKLGFTSVHFPNSWQEIDKHVFSNDSPISARFEELDQRYPNSVFIYTTRPLEQWVPSCLKWFCRPSRRIWVNFLSNFLSNELKDWYNYGNLNLYGRDVANLACISEKELVAAYYRHDTRVKNYFMNRRSDVLKIDVTDRNTMPLTTLVKFLEQHNLIGFPQVNKQGAFAPLGEIIKNDKNILLR